MSEDIFYLYTKEEKPKEQKRKRNWITFLFFVFIALICIFLIKTGISRHPLEPTVEELGTKVIESMKTVKSFSVQSKAKLIFPDLEINFERRGREGFFETAKTDSLFKLTVTFKNNEHPFFGSYDFEGEVKSFGNDVFLIFHRLPEKDFFGNELSFLKNNWIKIDNQAINQLRKEITADEKLYLDPELFTQKLILFSDQLVSMSGFPGKEVIGTQPFIIKERVKDDDSVNKDFYHFRIILDKESIQKSLYQMLRAASRFKNDALRESVELNSNRQFFPLSLFQENKFTSSLFSGVATLIKKEKNEIGGEIFIDKKNDLIHKIKWQGEFSSLSLANFVGGKIIFEIENEFSDYNQDFSIEKPGQFLLASQIFKDLKYDQKLKSFFLKQLPIKRDNERKLDIIAMADNLEEYYILKKQYPATSTFPFPLTDPGNGPCDRYFWISNLKDPKKFCLFACLENGNFFAASHNGVKEIKKRPTDLDCF